MPPASPATGTVLNLTFQAETDAAGSQILVTFQNPDATDAALGDTAVATQDGQVTIASRPLGDVNGDCVIVIFDVNRVVQAWRTELGDFEYDMDADLNDDDEINIIDVMIVARDIFAECQ